jgi:hypothetical protein
VYVFLCMPTMYFDPIHTLYCSLFAPPSVPRFWTIFPFVWCYWGFSEPPLARHTGYYLSHSISPLYVYITRIGYLGDGVLFYARLAWTMILILVLFHIPGMAGMIGMYQHTQLALYKMGFHKHFAQAVLKTLLS